MTSGTYKPTNYTFNDLLSDPAPRPGIATNLAGLTGSAVNGNWNLYVFDDAASDQGAITNGWTLTLHTTTSPPPRVVISEFRVRGPNGSNDEYVVLHNLSDYPQVVTSVDTSAGWSVAATNGIRFVVTNGTVFAPRGYFLGVNTSQFSLATHPAGSGSTATGDVNFANNIPDNAGIALFRSAIPTNLVLATRLDAVGSSSEGNALYKEGAGYPALTPFSIDYAFVRNRHSGEYQDTDDNVRDFLFVDSNGTSAGAGQRLGAPGPRNRTSPSRLIHGDPQLLIGLVDVGVGMSDQPNRLRSFTADPANNSTFGTLSLRRRIFNDSVASITRLRFRVVDLTTFPRQQASRIYARARLPILWST